MSRIERSILALARRQHGLITHHQATAMGAPPGLVKRRTRAGHWQRIASGVYRIGAAPATFKQRCMAAVLAAGPGALISHRTAAWLWGVITRSAVPIEVSIPRGRRHHGRGVTVHTSTDVDLAQATTIDGIPVTGLARTLLDLGAVEPGRVRKAVWDARRHHELTWEQLLQTLVDHGRSGRNGVGPLRRVVAEHYGELARDSATEDLAFTLLRDSDRVPVPASQTPVLCADGVQVTTDFGWPRLRAYLEIVGAPHFLDEDLQHLDLHRRNEIELAGNGLLIYSGRMLRQRPDQFVNDVIELLRSCGWDGTPSTVL